jgi:Flp pilus assembly protein TadD
VFALMDAIFGKKGLGITYDSAATRTAIETFKAKSGNCLSFTVLFVALARHLGLKAYFEEVDEVISWDRRGEVVVRNLHMVVDVELENGHQRVDFLPEAEKRYRAVRRISDTRALAHYHNNLGVDALASGDPRQALTSFTSALAADPTFGYAWTNLGVAQRRLGDVEAAERSHLKALEIDHNEPAALANLASLYLAQGLTAKAAPLQRRVDAHLERNPFHHYRQGAASLRAGNLAAAIESFREATRRMPAESEFHAALGEALARSGETDKARKSLAKALELTDDTQEKARLEEELAALEAEG